MAYRIIVGGTAFIAICAKEYSNTPATLSQVNKDEGNALTGMMSWGAVFFHEIMHVLPINRQFSEC